MRAERDFKMPQLHQQEGGISLQVFAAQNGISEQSLRKYIHAGKVLGASKHPLTKKWCIYPPAKLLVTPRVVASRSKASDEVHQDTRRPRTPSEIQSTEPFTVDKVSPGTLPDVFASRSVKDCIRSVELVASHKFCPVVLSGAQLLLVERALLHESQAIRERYEAHEFEQEARSTAGDELQTLYSALRVLKEAAKAKNITEGNKHTQENRGKP